MFVQSKNYGLGMDPLIKREQFAVSLRKKKSAEIIQQKRIKLAQAKADDYLIYDMMIDKDSNLHHYFNGYTKFQDEQDGA